jgi:hypothetical protein
MAGTYIEIGGGSGGGSSGPQPWQHSVATAAALPALGDEDGQLVYVRDTESIYAWDAGGSTWNQILNGLADVSGPGSAVNEQVAVFDGVTGKAIKASPVEIDSTGNVSGVADLTASGEVAADSVNASSYVQLPVLTTVQRDALTASNGMVVYNSSVHLVQGYVNGSWVNLHGWGA